MGKQTIANAMSQLSSKQQKAAEALAGGEEVEAAAALAGVSPSTVYRWKRTDAFQDGVKALGDAAAHDFVVKLQGVLMLAYGALYAVLEDNETPPAVKLRAFDLASANALKWREAMDVQQRLEELEERLENAGH